MKKILVFTVLILSIVAYKTGAANREIVLIETPDGSPFYCMPIHEKGVTNLSIVIAWSTDWAYDTKNNPAVPYVATQAILNGGTETLSQRDILELFKDIKVSSQIYAWPNYVVGQLTFPEEHIEDVVPIVSEALASPQFGQKWVNRIKHGILANQKKMQTANQLWTAGAIARLAILGTGPLNDFLSLPDLAVIKDVSVDDLRRWHAETIVKDGARIMVAGAVGCQKAGEVVDQLLSHLPNGSAITPSKTEPDFTPKTILLHRLDAKKTTLGLFGPLPSTSEDSSLIDSLVLRLFARSGNGGPLFDAVRTKLRASYGFQASFVNYDRTTRVMSILGEVETKKLAQTLDLIRTTYESYRSNPDLGDLDSLRQSMADEAAQNVQHVNVVAGVMLELVLNGFDPTDAPRLGKLLAGITAQEVKMRLRSAYPSSDNLIIIAVSPDKIALPGACIVTNIEQAAQCP